jgi:hypothetical protein
MFIVISLKLHYMNYLSASYHRCAYWLTTIIIKFCSSKYQKHPGSLTKLMVTYSILFFLNLDGNGQTLNGIVEDNKLIIDINNLTYTLANEHDQFYSFIGVRALTLVHLSIHDILNARYHKFSPYLFDQDVDEAVDVFSAAIESTRTILAANYLDRMDTINQVCDEWLSERDQDYGRDRGIRLGQRVANMFLADRANDGHEKNGEYTPMTKPGDYQHTPGFDYVWKPDFSVARPFTLDSVSQFRSPAPPDLNSQEYADSYREVKVYGCKNSLVRTPDQKAFGHWWAEFGEHGWNRIGRITTKERHVGIIETNRMFALLNMNLYDLYLASFESKYFYDTWRPYTAIRNGASDGNDATSEQRDWEPDMVTPPWPEYPSAHAAVGASCAEIAKTIYGTSAVSFTMKSTTGLPGFEYRSYRDLDQAAQDCADSRIMNGYHFRFATEEGLRQGRRIARHTLNNFLIPLGK